MSSKIPEDLIYAAFFFIDIVGLSNPILSTKTQKTKIKILNELISNCKTFVDSKKEDLLILPTGDGMIIGFKNGLEQPLKLSIEFHKKLANYNKDAINIEKIETRIGCHIGHVFIVNDVQGNVNLWGPGSILARRVMDMGDANHILLSKEIADDLIEISPDYQKIFFPLHNFGIKHGDNLLVYSACGDDFGNSTLPKEKIKINAQISEGEKNSICEKIVFDIILKDSSERTRFERTYYFSNQSKVPIYEVVVNVLTNSKDEFQELNLKAYDERNNKLDIAKILASTPYSKKFIIKLSKPIFNEDKGRYLKIGYDSKLTKNYFENFFTTDTSIFELNLRHYSNIELSPVLYYMDTEQSSKDLIEVFSNTTIGMFKEIKWTRSQGIKIKDGLHLEW